VFECDGDGDCNAGEHCCLAYAGQSLSPAGRCETDACEIPFECSDSSGCAPGEVCCGIGITVLGGTRYTGVVCQKTACGEAPNYEFCRGGSPCPDGTSCSQSSHFPAGYVVCK
jgi:hypothetical protein